MDERPLPMSGFDRGLWSDRGRQTRHGKTERNDRPDRGRGRIAYSLRLFEIVGIWISS